MINIPFNWWNFRTETWETTDAVWRDTIPQTPSALGLFDVLCETGVPEVEAAKRVLSILVNKTPNSES